MWYFQPVFIVLTTKTTKIGVDTVDRIRSL